MVHPHGAPLKHKAMDRFAELALQMIARFSASPVAAEALYNLAAIRIFRCYFFISLWSAWIRPAMPPMSALTVEE